MNGLPLQPDAREMPSAPAARLESKEGATAPIRKAFVDWLDGEIKRRE